MNTHEFFETLTDPERTREFYPELSSEGPSPILINIVATLGGHHRAKKWSKRVQAGIGVASLALTAAGLAGADVISTSVTGVAGGALDGVVQTSLDGVLSMSRKRLSSSLDSSRMRPWFRQARRRPC